MLALGVFDPGAVGVLVLAWVTETGPGQQARWLWRQRNVGTQCWNETPAEVGCPGDPIVEHHRLLGAAHEQRCCNRVLEAEQEQNRVQGGVLVNAPLPQP